MPNHFFYVRYGTLLSRYSCFVFCFFTKYYFTILFTIPGPFFTTSLRFTYHNPETKDGKKDVDLKYIVTINCRGRFSGRYLSSEDGRMRTFIVRPPSFSWTSLE